MTSNRLAPQTSGSSPPPDDAALRLETIIRMLIAFRDRPADPEATAREYVETTAEIPLPALIEACKRFKTGYVGDRNNAFAPSTAELADLARQIAARAERVSAPPPALPPPDVPPDPAVGRKLSELADELRRGGDWRIAGPESAGAALVRAFRETQRNGGGEAA